MSRTVSGRSGRARSMRSRTSALASSMSRSASKEIEIHTNGKLSYRGKAEPEAGAILEEARRFKDRKLVWVNRVEVTVDAEPVIRPGEER